MKERGFTGGRDESYQARANGNDELPRSKLGVIEGEKKRAPGGNLLEDRPVLALKSPELPRKF